MEQSKYKKIMVVIPCYNEEMGIAKVIEGFNVSYLKSIGYDLRIMVVDNNSSDNTAEVARNSGAIVIHEPKKGKGNAIRTGFQSVPKDIDYVVMLDGDNTYRSQEILRLIEPINSGFCNVVIGSRLGGRISKGSMTTLNFIGNWIFSHLVRYIYKANVTDVLTGYFAWKREVLENLQPHLKSSGFAIEMEMITKMSRLGDEIFSVPISYDSREGVANLRPFYDGSRILCMLVRNIFWKPRKEKVKKIAFVSDAIMPYHIGGKERRLYEISRRLVSDTSEVHIYTMKWWDGENTIQKDGVHLHAISKLYPLYKEGRRSFTEAILFGLATFKLLWADFDTLDVDCVPLLPIFSARIITWIRGKKLYVTWHEIWGREYWLEYIGGVSGSIANLIEKMALLLPDVIISNSKHTTERLRNAGFKRPIKTIPLGVDVKNIYNAQAKVNRSDVIYVGRLIENKKVDHLIKAIGILKETVSEIKCNIVGNGPEKANYESLIKELKLENNVKILSDVKESVDLYGLMKSSKMLVLPSVREGFGLVVLEANAAGIPVITTNHKDNAAKDLILENINGLTADSNENSIAEKILQVLENGDAMKPRSEIHNYDWDTVIKSFREISI